MNNRRTFYYDLPAPFSQSNHGQTLQHPHPQAPLPSHTDTSSTNIFLAGRLAQLEELLASTQQENHGLRNALQLSEQQRSKEQAEANSLKRKYQQITKERDKKILETQARNKEMLQQVNTMKLELRKLSQELPAVIAQSARCIERLKADENEEETLIVPHSTWKELQEHAAMLRQNLERIKEDKIHMQNKLDKLHAQITEQKAEQENQAKKPRTQEYSLPSFPSFYQNPYLNNPPQAPRENKFKIPQRPGKNY